MKKAQQLEKRQSWTLLNSPCNIYPVSMGWFGVQSGKKQVPDIKKTSLVTLYLSHLSILLFCLKYLYVTII